MDQLNGTDLAALHQAIVTGSAAAFPGVHFEFYRQDRKSLPMGDGVGSNPPKAYALLELSEMDASEADPGTDQQALVARFEAEIVMKSLQTNAKVQVRALAGSFASFLRRKSRWPNVLTGPARVVGVYKDDFSPELDQYEVWRVEWTHEIWLGAGVDVFVIPADQTASGNPELTPEVPGVDGAPTIPGIPALTARPEQALFSYVPVVGIPYEPEYRDITGAPRVE